MVVTRTVASKEVQNSCCRTDIKLSELRHTWTINNFSFCQEEVGKALESPPFGTTNGLKWMIKIYPKGNSEGVRDYVSLFLYLAGVDENGPKGAEVKYRFTFLNSKQEPIYNNNAESSYWKFETVGRGRGYTQFIMRRDLNELLRDDQLTVCCKLVIRVERVDTFSELKTNVAQPSLPAPEYELSTDLGSMFISQQFGDVLIEVEGKELLAYKGILQARSPVFAAMFSHGMQEQIQNRVVITDVKYEVMEELLTFIHTGRSPNLGDRAHDLLPLADKYDLARLKIMAGEVLSARVTRENAVDLLILADLHSAHNLKKSVIDFIIADFAYFLGRSVWVNIVLTLSERPNVMADLTTALFAFTELI